MVSFTTGATVLALRELRRLYYGWVLVLTLGITETISWGVLYYAFTVFVAPMQAELGWSRADTTGAFSLALFLSGVAAYPVGRWLDRHGARLLMAAGSCAGVLLVLAWSRVQSLPTFYLVWAGIGLTMAMLLYQPAFAVIATWFSRRRARALTLLTLIAGWASIIFVPLAGWLVQAQGWRAALATLALILAAGTILPHALVLRRRPEDLGLGPDGVVAPPLTAQPRERHPAPIGAVLRQPTFRWLAVAFCLAGFSEASLSVHLVPYLIGHGYPPSFAAGLVGLVGGAALLGRVVFAPFGERMPQQQVAAGIFLFQATALLVLLLLGQSVVGVLAFAILFGAGRGATTLARANLLAALYGRERYASISGALALFMVSAQSIAPVTAGAAFDVLGRYEPLYWGLVGLSVAAATAVLRATGLGEGEAPDARPALETPATDPWRGPPR